MKRNRRKKRKTRWLLVVPSVPGWTQLVLWNVENRNFLLVTVKVLCLMFIVWLSPKLACLPLLMVARRSGMGMSRRVLRITRRGSKSGKLA